MDTFHVIALLLTLTALFSYLNDRYIKLHPSVGVMLISLLLSLGLIAAARLGLNLRPLAVSFMQNVQFDTALIHWMLGFLLFGGALAVDLPELGRTWRSITLLATLGTVLSTLLVAAVAYPVLRSLGVDLPWLDCLLLGALISPTDPVAVVGFIRSAKAPKSIETIVAAESLFNDGVGVVIFLTILGLAFGGETFSVAAVAHLFLQKALGGALLGLLGGYFVRGLLRKTNNFQLQALLTLSLVMAICTLSDLLNLSGPIAVVVAGLPIGDNTEPTDLSRFWDLIEEILNSVLFVLVGLEMLLISYSLRQFVAALLCIPLVLLARWISIRASLLPTRTSPPHGLIPILVWGGLRGGLALAMALLIPPGAVHDRIVAITYGVVAFSILIQGTTLRRLVQKAAKPNAELKMHNAE